MPVLPLLGAMSSVSDFLLPAFRPPSAVLFSLVSTPSNGEQTRQNQEQGLAEKSLPAAFEAAKLVSSQRGISIVAYLSDNHNNPHIYDPPPPTVFELRNEQGASHCHGLILQLVVSAQSCFENHPQPTSTPEPSSSLNSSSLVAAIVAACVQATLPVHAHRGANDTALAASASSEQADRQENLSDLKSFLRSNTMGSALYSSGSGGRRCGTLQWCFRYPPVHPVSPYCMSALFRVTRRFLSIHPVPGLDVATGRVHCGAHF